MRNTITHTPLPPHVLARHLRDRENRCAADAAVASIDGRYVDAVLFAECARAYSVAAATWEMLAALDEDTDE